MRAKAIAYSLVIILLILLQTTLLEYIKIFDVKPNLLMIFIVSIALIKGNVEGAVVGFFCGLSQDMVSGRLIGVYALLGMYLGMIVGSLNKRLYRENILVIVFFTFVSTFAYELAVYFSVVFFDSTTVLYALRNIILPESVFNSVASLGIYIFVLFLNERLEIVDRGQRRY